MSDDITRCPGGECPRRDDCYRFRARIVGRFDAFVRPPYDPATGACEEYVALATLEPTEAEVRTRAYDLWQRRGGGVGGAGGAEADWSAAQAEIAAALAGRLRDGGE